MRTAEFVNFIVAREQHRLAKEAGRWPTGVKPDPIIAEYRFCNVRRNDDRVTRFIIGHIVEPFADDENLWFYLVIARMFNKPETLRAFPYAQFRQWKPEHWRKRLKQLRENGPIFNGAYIVSTNGMAMDKVDYVVDLVLSPLWKARKMIGKMLTEAKTLNAAHRILMNAQGLGSFMAAQVLADLKYSGPAVRWEDFHTFAASGPGSRRGINRVFGGPVKASRTEEDFREKLRVLREDTNKALRKTKMRHLAPMTAQDIQNCLCEFDKYERARLGEGKPKQKYTPAPNLPWKE